MTTQVFSAVPKLHKSQDLVCQLQDISPDEAIERLHKLGILAIEGEAPSSIVLVGFHHDVAVLLDDFANDADPAFLYRHHKRLMSKLAS